MSRAIDAFFSLPKIFTKNANFYGDIMDGFVCGHIYSKIYGKKGSKWTQYVWTIIITSSSLNSAQRLGYFKRYEKWIVPIKYGVIILEIFNFLIAFSHPGAHMEETSTKSFALKVWDYTPYLFVVTHIVLTILEGRDHPLKAVGSIVGAFVTQRDKG